MQLGHTSAATSAVFDDPNLVSSAGLVVALAKATTATIPRKLTAVPTRISSSARRITLHLPTRWPWLDPWLRLFAHGHGPPPTDSLRADQWIEAKSPTTVGDIQVASAELQE
jgi:hypothetical protein